METTIVSPQNRLLFLCLTAQAVRRKGWAVLELGGFLKTVDDSPDPLWDPTGQDNPCGSHWLSVNSAHAILGGLLPPPEPLGGGCCPLYSWTRGLLSPL
jgi:hypothetical protein